MAVEEVQQPSQRQQEIGMASQLWKDRGSP